MLKIKRNVFDYKSDPISSFFVQNLFFVNPWFNLSVKECDAFESVLGYSF